MLLVDEHKESRFGLRFDGKRNVNSHLVAVEVRVERAADERVEFYRSALDKNGFERLNAETVKRRRTVKHYGMVFDNVFENVPHCRFSALYGTLCTFDVVADTCVSHEFVHDERLKEFERHFFGKTALIQFEFGSDDDNRTTGIVYTFTEKVLTETTLLAAEHRRKGI